MAQVLPDVLDRVQLRGPGGQKDHRDVLGDREGSGGVPPGSIEQQDGMGAICDGTGDLVEVKLHCLRVGERQRQGGSRATRRTDGAEKVGAFVALVSGLARPRSASRPLPHEAVLLADPGLVLEPDLDRLSTGDAGQVGAQGGREVFLNASIVR